MTKSHSRSPLDGDEDGGDEDGGDGLVLHVLHHGHSLEILSVRNHFYVRLRKA